MEASLAVFLFLQGIQAAGGLASEAQFEDCGQTIVMQAGEMFKDTIYQGAAIHLSSTREKDGTWTGTAQLLGRPDLPLKTAERFKTGEEALTAALSSAMAFIDIERKGRGKP
jgi:hypothetical protein